MKKKTYEQPRTVVVKLQHKEHLLQVSGQTGVQDYNVQPYYEE